MLCSTPSQKGIYILVQEYIYLEGVYMKGELVELYLRLQEAVAEW